MKLLRDLTMRDMERLEREAFTRDELRRELVERERDDEFDPWYGRSLTAAKAQHSDSEGGAS